MTRKKIKLTWIANTSARKASLKKRRLGLVKKAMELTTLCGIKACLIIYSPGENDPIVWSSHDDLEGQLEKFYQAPELERSKKTMNLETYFKERLSKSQDQLMKLKRKNMEVEMGNFMLQIHRGRMMADFNVNELSGLIWFMETKMKDLRKCIEYYKGVSFSSVTPSQGNVPLVPPPQGYAGHDIGTPNTNIGDDETNKSLLWNHWFHDTTIVNNLGLPRPLFGGTSSSNVAPPLELPRPDSGLPRHSYRGSSSVVAELRASRPSIDGGSSSSFVGADLRLQGQSFGGSSSATPHHGLPPFETFIGPTTDMGLPEGENFVPFGGHDMGPGHYPFGPLGSGSPRSEFEGNHFGPFDEC